MSSEATESDIQSMLGDDLVRNDDSPTASGSAGGSNSLDMSPRAIERLRAELRRDNDHTDVLARIMVEVVDETTGRLVVHPSSFDPQGIQTKDCHSTVHLDQMNDIRTAYNIP